VTEDSNMPSTTVPALAAEPQPVPPQAADPRPGAATAPVRDAHLDRLQELLRLETANDDAKPHRRGQRRRRHRRQQARQRLQQRIRREAVDCYHHLQDEGCTLEQCGRLLNLAPRTLRQWEQDCRLSRPETITLAGVGRPTARSPLPVRQEIIDYLKLTGPGIGVPTLQEHFRDVARAELADLLARYRAVCRARHDEWQRVLHWQTPGRVWAADFTEPSRYGLTPSLPPIAGLYPYVLAVRDLASGCMLAWQALPNLTEAVTSEALARLFARHGAPLILKTDNGSAFRADAFKQFLETSGVIPLYSPPSCPGYNGAIEAAIGSLKKRTEQHAREQGRSGLWALDDLEAGQTAANASHPRRLNGRTPTSVWESRTLVDSVERVVFALTVERQRFQARTELGIGQEESLDHWRSSAVDRTAIERALVEHGHLLFTRRRIPLPLRAGKVARDV
jgi:transposase InsO family protein